MKTQLRTHDHPPAHVQVSKAGRKGKIYLGSLDTEDVTLNARDLAKALDIVRQRESDRLGSGGIAMVNDPEPRAVAATDNSDSASVTIQRANGCAFVFPVSRYPELATGSQHQLAQVQIDLDGEALVWDEPNFCVSVPGLIMAAVGGWERWVAS